MLRYQVPDMSCGHCVQAVTQAVTGVDPNAEVAADLDTKSVKVVSTAQDELILQALRDAGYPAEAAA